ncbi:MAG: RNA methyltransferase [Bryobacter sp.]|nr:RNA methyltransferase [Bryobacter sp.]
MRSPAPREIQSLQNPWIKEIRRAVRKGAPTEEGWLVVEGRSLCEEAKQAGWRAVAAFTSGQIEEPGKEALGKEAPEATRVPTALMKELSSLDHPAGWIALMEAPPREPWEIQQEDLVLVLDGIQDPGNAGTLLRSAEAFGVAGVIALRGTVELFSPKVIRASAGSIFRIPVRRQCQWEDLHFPAGFPLYAAMPSGGKRPSKVDWRRGGAILIGNEGAGVSRELAALAQPLTIPTHSVESLNAAVAGAILLYEATRR